MDKEDSKENLSRYFDTQVDRFSNLVTGQQSIIDAPIMLKELAVAAKTLAPNANNILDIGCGGGVLLVSDFLLYDNEKLQAVEMARWENYLRQTLGDGETERILASVAATDTPRSIEFQLNLLKNSGFKDVAVLHKENLFAAYCAVK